MAWLEIPESYLGLLQVFLVQMEAWLYARSSLGLHVFSAYLSRCPSIPELPTCPSLVCAVCPSVPSCPACPQLPNTGPPITPPLPPTISIPFWLLIGFFVGGLVVGQLACCAARLVWTTVRSTGQDSSFEDEARRQLELVKLKRHGR